MTDLHLVGSLIAADTETRTVTGRLLPYNEQGNTSAGAVTVAAGVVQLPTDPASVILNAEHDRTRPLGRCVGLQDTSDGLTASFKVANTRAGDEYLAEVSEGLRGGLSVELDQVVIRAGKLLGGILTHVGAVVTPAFPTALLTAADAGEIETETPTEGTTMSVDLGVEYQAQIDGADPVSIVLTETPADQPDDQGVADEQAQASARRRTPGLVASAPAGSNFRAGRKQVALGDAYKLIATAFNSTDGQQLTAALADITQTGVGDKVTQPGWLGELWSGKAYNRRFVPLLNNGTLTALKIAGWRWVNKPVMQDYAGDKAAVPSNVVTVEGADTVAKRCAGAWDIDRALFDFGSSDFIASFLQALTESYARLSDGRALTAIHEAAMGNVVAPDVVPANVSAGMAAIVDGVLSLVDHASPTFAIAAPDVYRSILLTRNDDSLQMLSAALGMESGEVLGFKVLPAPSGVLDAGEVIVGAKEAVTYYELGESPIRVEAENIPQGGRDLGVFGYTASIVNDSKAIALVSA